MNYGERMVAVELTKLEERRKGGDKILTYRIVGDAEHEKDKIDYDGKIRKGGPLVHYCKTSPYAQIGTIFTHYTSRLREMASEK